ICSQFPPAGVRWPPSPARRTDAAFSSGPGDPAYGGSKPCEGSSFAANAPGCNGTACRMACCEWGCGPQPGHGNGRRIIAARLARNIMRFAANTTGAGASRLGADRETASNLGSVGGTRLLAWQGKAAEAPTCTASCTVQNVASKQPYCGGLCALAYTL